nr:transcription factor C subunit 6 [Naematelia aurantialba]
MSGMPQTEEDAEVGSLSSGGASEYAPPDDEPGPSRKGKARATTNKLIDSDDAMSSGAAVEESDVDEEGEDLKPVTHSSGLPHRKSGGGVIFPPTYHSSDLHLFPQAYRQLIKEASARLAKPDPTAEDLRRDKERLKVLDKLRATGLDAFPHGPTTPFITRLLEKPGVGSERIKVDLDGGRTHERKKRTKMITDHSQLLEAWESWQGEAWWPEMFGSNSKQSKGKGRMSAKGGGSELPSGWVHRSEVTLGLAQVGRIPLDKLDLLSEEAAQPFLPRLAEHTKAPTVNVYLGLHDDQKPVRFGMYDAHRLEEFGNTKPGSIFYTGGPIWGMDWCPVSDRAASVFGGTQYLAVSVMPNIDATPGIGLKCAAEETASIQIWSMIPSALETGEMGQLSCDMVLCVEGGSGIEVRWMPLGACDEVDLAKVDSAVLPKLGILGVVQLDGSLSFYAVPHPKVIRHLRGMDDSSKRPLYVRVKPLLKIEVDDAACMCFDYVSGTRVAVGLSNGQCGGML